MYGLCGTDMDRNRGKSEMAGTDDDVLAREIEKLGALGAGAGGSWFSSIVGRGARWVARLLPNNTAEFTLEVEAAPETVKEAVVGILLQEGNIILRGKSCTPVPSVSAGVCLEQDRPLGARSHLYN